MRDYPNATRNPQSGTHKGKEGKLWLYNYVPYFLARDLLFSGVSSGSELFVGAS